jgi:hypothetical protein
MSNGVSAVSIVTMPMAAIATMRGRDLWQRAC